jgi:hypothetical protein
MCVRPQVVSAGQQPVSSRRQGAAGHRQWVDYQLLCNWMVLLVLSGCLRNQWLTVAIYANEEFNVRKGITSETAIKLTHKEIGFLRKHCTDEKMCI